MKLELDIPDKVSKHFDDIVTYVKKINPDKSDITIESILVQTVKNTVISMYSEYLNNED